jgi:hypothetical protein
MKHVLLFTLILFTLRLPAQEVFNYDESKVGNHALPPLLPWNKAKRAEVLQLFTTQMYGVYPGKPSHTHIVVQRVDNNALHGTAISKQVRLYLAAGTTAPFIDILLYLPKNSKKPVPVFVGCNFMGNHTVDTDTNLLVKETPKPAERGFQERRWEAAKLIENGFGLATYYYGDIEADTPDGWKTGVRTTLQEDLKTAPSAWAALSVWGWGLSRMLDYLETEKGVDAKRVIITGHSRLGKAALWAAVNDTRFAAIVSNNSGEGGAAISRRWYGETITRINAHFPHWFVDAYKQYNDKPETLPFDQHMLLALMAPRPIYVASATEDRWSDPKGEFLSAKAVEPLYKESILKEIPEPEHPVGKHVRYHLRVGKHDILWYDWQQYILFAKEELY